VDAENAGQENAGQINFGEGMHDWKMTDKNQVCIKVGFKKPSFF